MSLSLVASAGFGVHPFDSDLAEFTNSKSLVMIFELVKRLSTVRRDFVHRSTVMRMHARWLF